MTHPAVVACAMRTARATKQYEVLDNRVARGTSEMMHMLATSRDLVARSRHLLAELEGRGKRTAIVTPEPNLRLAVG